MHFVMENVNERVWCSEPFKKEFFEKRTETVKKLGRYDELLQNRITYIVQQICKIFNLKFRTWYFPDAAEGELGSFEKASYHDSVRLTIDYSPNIKGNQDMIILMKDGGEWELYEIPKRWLSEDFEEELEQGRVNYLKKLEDEKVAAKEQLSKEKAEEKALLAQIKKKLTPSELRLLKKVM